MDEKELSKRPSIRQRAVELLYQIELTGKSLDEVCLYADPEVSSVQRELVENVWDKREYLDQKISEASYEWRIERMGYVERNVLRLALYEIYYSNTPIPLAIDVAVELAKLYSGEEAGRFVNGVLGRIVRERESEQND
ncbi:MAG TPA: transcription antitermination factor NusB [Firmicutes bacterium]|jgi:N utilization substance protein B|nr:transcription antitermination factor NusB [Bacillota bacterium]